jgi:hypothetical protein
MESLAHQEAWPALSLAAWRDTLATLHMWTQVVGKIRLVSSPWTNHSWHVTLYVTARGLTTSPIPRGERSFQIDFDFVSHELLLQSSDGQVARWPLQAESVASFYGRLMEELDRMDLHVAIRSMPCEVEDAIPFDSDVVHCAYDPEYANRFWRVLLQSDRVFKEFRARFKGKCSPVHFFWGAPDLAVTRFSGRPAPKHTGGVPHLADWVTQEAYSHEVSSCGFWAGDERLTYPVFYSYAYPSPAGFADAKVQPAEAFFHQQLGEFLLPYDAVRLAPDPDSVLLAFLESTFAAAASLGHWDPALLTRRLDGADGAA